jgi:hypothetical protein
MAAMCVTSPFISRLSRWRGRCVRQASLRAAAFELAHSIGLRRNDHFLLVICLVVERS